MSAQFGYQSNYGPRDQIVPQYGPPAPTMPQTVTPGGANPLGGIPGGSTSPYQINWNPAQTQPINYAYPSSAHGIRPGFVDDPNNRWAPETEAYMSGQTIYPGAANPLTGAGISNGQATSFGSKGYRDGHMLNYQMSRLTQKQLQELTSYMPQVRSNFQGAVQDLVNSRMSPEKIGENRDYLQAAHDTLVNRMKASYLY